MSTIKRECSGVGFFAIQTYLVWGIVLASKRTRTVLNSEVLFQLYHSLPDIRCKRLSEKLNRSGK